MELKVVCDCGQKYKFDVEPVNGQMPYAVTCPICGVDGTGAANTLLAQLPPPSLSSMPLPPIGSGTASPPPLPTPPPIPVVQSIPVPPPVPAPRAGGLQLNRTVQTPGTAYAGPAPATPPIAAPRPGAPRTTGPAPALPKYMQTNETIQNNNFAMGILGAFLGVAVGIGILYGFYMLTSVKMPLIGTISGALTGFGARLFYKGTSSTLGAMSAAVAFVGIGATLFVMFGILGMLFSIISLVVAVSLAFKIASG